jgi:hypothetical protein
MKSNKYKNKSLGFPHFPQLLSPSRRHPFSTAPSAPPLLLLVVVPVSPPAPAGRRLSSNHRRSQPLLQPSPLLQAPQVTVPPPASLQIEALQASCVSHLRAAVGRWPSSRIQSSPLCQSPLVARPLLPEPGAPKRQSPSGIVEQSAFV